MAGDISQKDLVKLLATSLTTGFFMKMLDYSDFVADTADSLSVSNFGAAFLLFLATAAVLVWRF